MTRADRTVQLLGLAVAPSRRARFVEEWQSDLAAARSIGLSPSEIVAAAARVAALLLWLRVRRVLLRRRRRGEPAVAGVLLGFVLAVTDAPVAALVPFVVVVIGWRSARAVLAWVRGGA